MREQMTGRKFSFLTVVRYSRSVPRGAHSSKVHWICVCECGNEIEVQADNLRTGNTKSCGCQQGKRIAVPGDGKSPERLAWYSMLARCKYANRLGAKNYVGRGITVCERWKLSFVDFLADIGPRPSPSHSLDRIDNDGNYEPGNIRWATTSQQRRNRRDYIATHGLEASCR